MQLSMCDAGTVRVKKNTTNNNSGTYPLNRYCLLCPEVWLIRDTWKTRVLSSVGQLTHNITPPFICQAFLRTFCKIF